MKQKQKKELLLSLLKEDDETKYEYNLDGVTYTDEELELVIHLS